MFMKLIWVQLLNVFSFILRDAKLFRKKLEYFSSKLQLDSDHGARMQQHRKISKLSMLSTDFDWQCYLGWLGGSQYALQPILFSRGGYDRPYFLMFLARSKASLNASHSCLIKHSHLLYWLVEGTLLIEDGL